MNPVPTLESLNAWPLEERLELVFGLWDQIAEDAWRPEPSEELKAELRRRLAAFEADPSRGLTWEQVAAHVRRAR